MQERAGGSFMRLAPRETPRKHPTFSPVALPRPVPAPHSRQLSGDGKAKAGTAIAPRSERIGLGEVLKQFRLLLRSHANAGVSDRELDPVAPVRRLAHPQGDLTLFRELAGIA